MEKLYLVAAAHLDPAWQWDYEEGIAAALSTFRSAKNLLNDYDFIFCHGESNLYEWTKEYDPSLFEDIRRLIGEGKWKITGGWYVQSDAVLPEGETIARCILRGKEFFEKEFGTFPKTALCADSFGINRGIVQILRKCGQDSIFITRPHKNRLTLKNELFYWEGYDGSVVKAFRGDSYNTPMGKTKKALQKAIEKHKKEDIWMQLWGVGNHGGGPTRIDLQGIKELKDESNVEIIDSTPESFFDAVEPTWTFKKSLIDEMPGCYISSHDLKSKFIETERFLYEAEKASSIASLRAKTTYPLKELKEAEKELLFVSFHDVLPGDSIKDVNKDALDRLGRAYRLSREAYNTAIFSLARSLPSYMPGTYPFAVYNPSPYIRNENVEVEFDIPGNGRMDWEPHFVVYDQNGKVCLSQKIQERFILNVHHRQRVAFRATLPPSSVSLFQIKVSFKYKKDKPTFDGDITYEDSGFKVSIDHNNGLITSLMFEGKEYAKGPLFKPVLYEDDESPWGMSDEQAIHLGNNSKEIPLIKNGEGPFEGLSPIEIRENGKIYLSVDSYFASKNTMLRLSYRINKIDKEIDVTANVFWNESNALLRLESSLSEDGKLIGGEMFGEEELKKNGAENVSHRFVYMDYPKRKLAITHKNSYACCYENGILKFSLLRGCVYGCHPALPYPLKTPLVPPHVYLDRLDRGQNDFEFSLKAVSKNDLYRFVEKKLYPIYTVHFFPSETPEKQNEFPFEISSKNISVVSFKKCETKEGYMLRLSNNSAAISKTNMKVGGANENVSFNPFEVKTFLYSDGVLTEIFEFIV